MSNYAHSGKNVLISTSMIFFALFSIIQILKTPKMQGNRNFKGKNRWRPFPVFANSNIRTAPRKKCSISASLAVLSKIILTEIFGDHFSYCTYCFLKLSYFGLVVMLATQKNERRVLFFSQRTFSVILGWFLCSQYSYKVWHFLA